MRIRTLKLSDSPVFRQVLVRSKLQEEREWTYILTMSAICPLTLAQR